MISAALYFLVDSFRRNVCFVDTKLTQWPSGLSVGLGSLRLGFGQQLSHRLISQDWMLTCLSTASSSIGSDRLGVGEINYMHRGLLGK